MRAVIARRAGGPEVLELITVPLPEPGPGQIRIRVAAAGVNHVDVSTHSGALEAAGLLAPAPRHHLGWDVAGTVDARGPGAERFEPGAAVIGLRDVLSAPGTYADHVVLDQAAVAPAPTTVSPAEAAGLPLAGLTADQALTRSGVRAGQSLLVTGAAGGVGSIVVRLAAERGVRVVAVAAETDEPLLRTLGAAEFVGRSEPLAVAVRSVVPGGVDAVVDAAVLGIPAHEALRGGGTFVCLVRPFAPRPLRGTDVAVVEVAADGARLAELSAMVDAGLLPLRVAATMPLTEVAAAHERLIKGGLTGKVVLVP